MTLAGRALLHDGLRVDAAADAHVALAPGHRVVATPACSACDPRQARARSSSKVRARCCARPAMRRPQATWRSPRSGRPGRARRSRGSFGAMTYVAADDRYDRMPYRRCGRSGLLLPAVSLGLWQNFGARPPARRPARDPAARVRPRRSRTSTWPTTTGRRTARPRRTSGASWREDLRPYRDELIISTRRATTCGPARTASGARASTCSPRWTRASAGWGSTTSTSSTRTASTPTRRSRRRWARSTPPCARARRCTPASPPTRPSARARRRRSCASSARRCSSTSRPTRCSTAGSSRTCSTCSATRASAASSSRRSPRGCSPTSTSTASPRARAPARTASLDRDLLTEENLARVRALNEIAGRRGQTLAQMAVAWVLRDPRVTSALVGASSVAQLEDNVAALDRLDFTDDELAEIDRYAVESGINLWARSQPTPEAHLDTGRLAGFARRSKRTNRGVSAPNVGSPRSSRLRLPAPARGSGADRQRCGDHRAGPVRVADDEPQPVDAARQPMARRSVSRLWRSASRRCDRARTRGRCASASPGSSSPSRASRAATRGRSPSRARGSACRPCTSRGPLSGRSRGPVGPVAPAGPAARPVPPARPIPPVPPAPPVPRRRPIPSPRRARSARPAQPAPLAQSPQPDPWR